MLKKGCSNYRTNREDLKTDRDTGSRGASCGERELKKMQGNNDGGQIGCESEDFKKAQV